MLKDKIVLCILCYVNSTQVCENICTFIGEQIELNWIGGTCTWVY